MDPYREDMTKTPQPGAEQKPKRFRIVKLEERVAPGQHGVTYGNTCGTCNSCLTCHAGCTGPCSY